MKKHRWLFLILALLLVSTLALAETYYVDATSGNDENTGLVGHPWQTISKVNSPGLTYQPGDSILFKRGEEWRESPIDINRSGTLGNEITVGAYGSGALPIINASTIETGWSFNSTVNGLNVYEKTFSNPPRIVVEDDGFLMYLRWITNVSGTFQGARAAQGTWAFNGNTAYVCCTDNADPDTHTMEVGAKTGTAASAIRTTNDDHLIFEYLHLKHCTWSGVQIRITDSNSTNITVRYCTVERTGSVGIYFEDTAGNGTNYITGTISNNISRYCGAHGIHCYKEVKNCTISYNTVHHNGWYHEGTGGHGISSWSDGTTAQPNNNTIEYNTAYNTYRCYWGGEWKEGTGIHADGFTTDCTYRYNVSYDNEGAGFYENGQPTNNKWHYNIAYGNGTYQPDSGTAGFVCGHPDGSEYYNNVSYNNTNCGWASYDDYTSAPILKNNLFFENATHEIRMAGTGTTPPTSDYNCFYNLGGAVFRYNQVDYNFTNWKSQTSQDGNSVEADPDLVDEANADFHLTDNTSPCYEAGIDVSLTKDYDGTTVPTGTYPEIGAFEFVGGNEVSYLKITGTASKNAGEANELTITAYDSGNAVVTEYEGSKNLIFSGPGTALDNTAPTVEGGNMGFPGVPVNFTSGVSDANAATLICYLVESVSIDVTDGTYDSTGDPSYDLDLTISPAAPQNLIFNQHPTTAQENETIAPAVTANTRDDWWNICTTDSSTSVAIAISTNPSAGTLTGTSPQAAVNGVATFNDLSIDNDGAGYTLTVSAAGVQPALSNSFDIVDPYTYYVDATDGSDSDDGQSTGEAWKTISKVNGTTLVPGNSVLFQRGETWTEQLTIPNSGASGNVITIGAYGTGDAPIIDAEDTRAYCITTNSKDYIVIEQFTLTGATSANVLLDGTNQTDLNYCVSIDAVDGVEMDTTGSTVKNCVIYGCTNGIDVDAAGYVKNTIIRNCTDDLEEGGASINKTTNNIEDDADANPLMTDPASGDFTLQSLSPCIDAGTDLSLTTDHAGNSIPRIGNLNTNGRFRRSGGGLYQFVGSITEGTPDIGACEYISSYKFKKRRLYLRISDRLYLRIN